MVLSIGYAINLGLINSKREKTGKYYDACKIFKNFRLTG
jgi:hypothetical protein